jgi:hypothetical protein
MFNSNTREILRGLREQSQQWEIPLDMIDAMRALRGVTITGYADGAVAELLRAFDAMSYELGAIDQACADARARFTLTEDGDAGEGGGG